MTRRAAVQLPGTCGELFQGTLAGEPCLVSCPIARFGTVEVELRDGDRWEAPPDRPKTASAVRAGLLHFRANVGGRLRLHSELPRGRGYGSSTVDIGGTLFALGRALGETPSSPEIALLAASLEPTDSTLFPGLAVFSHRDGQRHELLGAVPPVEVLVLDPGGQVDTVQFNDLDHSATLSRLAADHLEAFALLKKSIATLDWAGVGQAATLSACAHQAILADDLGPVAWRLARDTRSLGVCRAHSGTLWGVLVDPLREDVNAIESYLTRRLPPGIAMHRERLVDGGPRVLTPSQTST